MLTMRNIIEELFLGNYEPSFHPSEEYCRLRSEQIRRLEKVRKGFSRKFVNDLETGEALLQGEEELSAFRHGFHLGALLMLDLLYGEPGSAS